jgi:hypothetical protein
MNQKEKDILEFRFSDIHTKRFVNRLVYFYNEDIFTAIERRVLKYEEPGFFLLQSLTMPVGSGKSNAALFSSKRLDPDFDIESVENLCFTGPEFLNAVKNIKKGQAVLFDEAGLSSGGGSREWHSKMNNVINSVMRLTRYKQGFVLLISPLSSFLDLRIRLLCNLELEMIGVNKQKNESYGTFRTLSLQSTPYGKYKTIEQLPIKILENGDIQYMEKFTFPRLKLKLWTQYLKRKQEALDQLDSEKKSEDLDQSKVRDLRKEIYKLRKKIKYRDQKECV